MSSIYRKHLIKILSLILVCSFVLSSCSKGSDKDETKSKKKNTNKVEDKDPDDEENEDVTEDEEESEATESYVDEMDDYWVEDNSTFEAEGDSPAISFSPCDGVHVNAKENQLYSDTEITFTPLADDSDPEVHEAMELLESNNVYALAAWDVNAGLDPYEVLPGSYNVSIDLDYLEIEPGLYEYLRIHRVDDDGNMFELNSTVDGSVIHYSSDQNSIVAVTIVIGCIAGYCIADNQRNGYYYDAKTKMYTADRFTKYGDFHVQWLLEDAEPVLHDKVKEATDLQNQHESEAKEYTKQFNSLSKYKQNAIMADRYKTLLEEDDRYQTLLKEIKDTEWPFPDSINFAIDAITDAYNYLGEAGYKMPKYKLEFKMMDKEGQDEFGAVQDPWHSRAYVELDITPLRNGTQGEKDNFRITVTHELFHICQNRYRTYFVDSVRFDEMVAMILEEDALEYYKKVGKIETDVTLTNKEEYGTLQIPMDEDPQGFSGKKLNSLLIKQGYTLGGFVSYLRKKIGTGVTAKTIMEARGYFSTPNTTEPLMGAFGISKADVYKYFREFAIENRVKIGQSVWDQRVMAYYHFPGDRFISQYSDTHMDLICEGSGSMTMRPIVQTIDYGYVVPYLIVPDEGTTLSRGNVDILPCGDYKETPKGSIYVPMGEAKKDDGGSVTQYMCILEIYGDMSDRANVEKGYTVYGLGQIGTPEFEYIKEDNKLKVLFPDKSASAQAGIIDGYYLKIESSMGLVSEDYFPLADIENEQFVDVSRLRPNERIGENVDLTATLCEYIEGNDGEKLMAIPSEKYEYSIKGEFYDSCDLTIEFEGDIMSIHISGGRFEGVKFDGEDFDGSHGSVWLLGHVKVGDTVSLTISNNTSEYTYDTWVKSYDATVTSSTTLMSEEGLKPVSITPSADDKYIEIYWSCKEYEEHDFTIHISYELVDEYTTAGIPELTLP